MSSPTSPLADLLIALAGALRRLALRWFLFGAQAAILHGAARLTADVDVTVDLAARPTGDLVEALGPAGFELRVTDVDHFVARTRVLPFLHTPTRIPVDVVLAGPGLEDLFFSRVESHVIAGVSIPVVAAEDLIAMKLLAGRAKDLEDVHAIVRTRGTTLDLDRVRATLRLLEQALDRRDLVTELDAVVSRVRRLR